MVCLYYKLIGINLSIIPYNINFTEKLDEDDGATMVFILEKQQKTILNFSSDLLVTTMEHKK